MAKAKKARTAASLKSPKKRRHRKAVSKKAKKGKGCSPRVKTCFVISPIGKTKSDERKHANLVFDNIIEPAARTMGYDAKRLDHYGACGWLNEGIIERLCDADLAIAVLSSLNANVLIEVGIRCAWCLPIVPIAEEGTVLPFDIAALGTVFYEVLKGRQQRARAYLAAQEKIVAQIASIERGESQVSLLKQAFKKAVRPMMRSYLFDSLNLALGDFQSGLHDAAREVEGEENRRTKEAAQVLAMHIRAPFTTLGDKWHLLKGFALRHNIRGLAKVGRRMTEFSIRGTKVNKRLHDNPPSDRNLQAVQKQLEEIIDEVAGLRETITKELA